MSISFLKGSNGKMIILDYVSFRSYDKPLRNVDHLTLNAPFSRTEFLLCSGLPPTE